jgi:hypothetical protein
MLNHRARDLLGEPMSRLRPPARPDPPAAAAEGDVVHAGADGARTYVWRRNLVEAGRVSAQDMAQIEEALDSYAPA